MNKKILNISVLSLSMLSLFAFSNIFAANTTTNAVYAKFDNDSSKQYLDTYTYNVYGKGVTFFVDDSYKNDYSAYYFMYSKASESLFSNVALNKNTGYSFVDNIRLDVQDSKYDYIFRVAFFKNDTKYYENTYNVQTLADVNVNRVVSIEPQYVPEEIKAEEVVQPVVKTYDVALKFTDRVKRPIYVYGLLKKDMKSDRTDFAINGIIKDKDKITSLKPGWYYVYAGSKKLGWLNELRGTPKMSVGGVTMTKFYWDKWKISYGSYFTLREDGKVVQGLVDLK